MVTFSPLQLVIPCYQSLQNIVIRNLRMMNCYVITTIRLDTAIQNTLFILHMFMNIYSKCS